MTNREKYMDEILAVQHWGELRWGDSWMRKLPGM